MKKRRPFNNNKRWNYGRWVDHYRKCFQNKKSRAFRKRRGNSKGTHK